MSTDEATRKKYNAEREKIAPLQRKVSMGQGMTEYTLVAVLIGAVAIAGLVLLGGNINNSFTQMLSTYTPKSSLPVSQPSVSAQPDILVTGPILPPVDNIGATNNNGMSLPNSPISNMSESVQTVGANGTVNILADTIKQQADQALSAGKIDEDQYNAIIKLSNEGHRLAEVFGLIEGAYAANGSKNIYDAGTSVTFEGKRLRIQDLVHSLSTGQSYTDPLPSDPLNMKTQPDSPVTPFLDQYKTVKTSLASSDPALESLITHLSTQIATVSASMEMAWLDYDANVIEASEFTSRAASRLADSNSAGICEAGSGKDSGKKCY